jgi:hypothetical protein
MENEVRRVDARNNVKPSQFSRPSIPATAPAKQEERNLTVVKELLC